MMDASGGGRPRGTGIGQRAGWPWRTGLAVFSVFGMLAAMSTPTVAQAAQVRRAAHPSHAAPLAQARRAVNTDASERGASCPPASPAAAGSATVGAPAGVRAIRGD